MFGDQLFFFVFMLCIKLPNLYVFECAIKSVSKTTQSLRHPNFATIFCLFPVFEHWLFYVNNFFLNILLKTAWLRAVWNAKLWLYSFFLEHVVHHCAYRFSLWATKSPNYPLFIYLL